MKPRCFSYQRVSTPKQQWGDGEKRQDEEFQRFVKSVDGIPVDAFKDLGVSGHWDKKKRKGLGDLLEAIERGIVRQGDYIVVEDQSRLSRQEPMDALNLLYGMVDRGIFIRNVRHNITITKENKYELSVFLPAVLESVKNEQYLKDLSKNVGAAWKRRRENIKDKPLTGMCPAWIKLNKDTKKFERIDDRVKIVKDIYKWYLQGMGVQTIVKQLNEDPDKYPPMGRKDRWVYSYVLKILTNRMVLGELQLHTQKGFKDKRRVKEGEPIKDYYPRVISDDDFNLVQLTMKKKVKHSGRPSPKHHNLFTGLIQCGFCEAPMHLVNKGRGSKALVCSNAKVGKGCWYIGYNYKLFEKDFLDFVSELDVKNILNGSQKHSLHDLNVSIANLEEVKKRINNLEEAIEKTGGTDGLYQRLKKANEEKTEAEENLRDAQTKTQEIKTIDPKEIQDLAKKLSDSVDTRMAFTESLKKSIELIGVYPNGIENREDTRKDAKSQRFFIVRFKNGEFRAVNPAGKTKTIKIGG